jgi:hypothetical protein
LLPHRWIRAGAASAVLAITVMASTAMVGITPVPAAADPAAPATVAILVAGYESSLSSTDTYNPLTQSSADVAQISADFDPQGIDATYGATGCSPGAGQPNLSASLQSAGALILPFSYQGATVSMVAGSPSATVNAYRAIDPSTILPGAAAATLDAEIASVHATWPTSHVVVVGHSEGGLVAETWWATTFTPATSPEVTGIFSLDSPINGIADTAAVQAVFSSVIAPALLASYQTAWDNRQANDAALLQREQSQGALYYVPGATGGDAVYRIADKTGPADGLASPAVGMESQTLLDTSGSPSSVAMVTDASPPKVTSLAGGIQPVIDTHDCPMGNSGVIAAITQRVITGTVPPLPSSRPLGQPGYRLGAADGGVFAYGDAGFYGSAGSLALDKPVVGVASPPQGAGYWLTAADGGVFAYGDAGFYGSAGGTALHKPVVGLASTPLGAGYWLVAADGGVFAYGDASFYGSAGGTVLDKPVVGMASTPNGGGYWFVAADGGVFAYGNAGFYGSAGGTVLHKPVGGMASTLDGGGYWLVAADGGVFAYGDAGFYGSAGGTVLDKPVVGMTAATYGTGYWLVAADGGVFAYGDQASFVGSAGGLRLDKPVIGMSKTFG